jgi:hypothetical protein
MSTIREILTDAMTLFGAYGVGEDPTDDDLQLAFTAFKSMRGQWANEKLIHPVETNSVFSWPSVTASRTIGAAGNLVAQKPLLVKSAFVRNSAGQDYQLQVITNSDYQDLMIKTQQSTLPGYLFYDPGESNISGTLYLWPIPDGPVSLGLTYLAPLYAYTTIDDTFVDPEGYQEAETYNLALRLAPRFGKQLGETDREIARDSKAAIKRNNADMDEMQMPSGLGGPGHYWNPSSGWWA